MKILLITGQSGTGKSTLAYELCRNNNRYNLIKSYTDRPRRPQEFDHTFVDKRTLDFIPMRKIVAFTKIGDYRYCSLYDQFVEDKINVYVVDADGIRDTLRAFPKAQIISVLISRENIYIDDSRKNRNIKVPSYHETTCEIDNNRTVNEAVSKLKMLCDFKDGFMFEISNHEAGANVYWISRQLNDCYYHT